MLKIVSTSTWKTCRWCSSYRRHVALVENVGPLCYDCVYKP
jgi:hypothetical protein